MQCIKYFEGHIFRCNGEVITNKSSDRVSLRRNRHNTRTQCTRIHQIPTLHKITKSHRISINVIKKDRKPQN